MKILYKNEEIGEAQTLITRKLLLNAIQQYS